jgi:hypothetical protein
MQVRSNASGAMVMLASNVRRKSEPVVFRLVIDSLHQNLR